MTPPSRSRSRKTCRLVRATTQSRHLCTEARNPWWDASASAEESWDSRLGFLGVPWVKQPPWGFS